MPKEYTLIGGNGTRVSPLEVTQSGTYEAGDSRAFNPVKVNVPSGSSTLSGLTDVDISNPTDGQTLVYNAESGKWENGAGAGGSGTLVVHQVTDGEDRRLDHTYAEISTAGYAVLWDTEDIGGGEYIVPVFPLVTLGYADLGGGSNPLYFVTFMLGEEQYQYTSRTQDGYPTLVK